MAEVDWIQATQDKSFAITCNGAVEVEMEELDQAPKIMFEANAYAICNGEYLMDLNNKVKGQPIWSRVEPDDKMFAFYNGNKWWIAGKQYKDEILEKDGGKGFISSMTQSLNFEESKWDDAYVIVISKEPFFGRSEFITSMAEEIAEGIFYSDESFGEKEIINQANGQETICRIVINLDCGYQFIQIRNDSDKTYSEDCKFLKFDNCWLMPPFAGSEYSVTVPPQDRRNILVRF